MKEIVLEILTKKSGYYNSLTLSIAYRDVLPSNPKLQGIVITNIRSDEKGMFKLPVQELEATGMPIFFDQVQSDRLRTILESGIRTCGRDKQHVSEISRGPI